MREPNERDTVTQSSSVSPERFARVRAVFEAALEYICSHDGVWRATGEEILNAYFQVNPSI